MKGKCRFKDVFDFCIVRQDNAEFILDRIGFGKQKCSETNHYDGRYGYWDNNDHALKYGFRDMHGVIHEDKYVVFDIDMPGSRDVYSKEQLHEYFEVLNEN